MVEMSELDMNSIRVLKMLVPKQFRFVCQFHLVLTEMLDVFFNSNLQVLSKNNQFGSMIEAVIIPSRVFRDQDVADSIVLSQPN